MFITMVVRFGSTIVLTRLLAPEVYGVYGTALAVIFTLEWFSDLGVMPALMRHPEGDTPTYLRTGWWINVARGSVLSVVCITLAYPLTHSYYRSPDLFPVLLALAPVSVLQALRSPAMPKVRRALDYRSLCVVELTQLFIGNGASVLFALLWHSVWAFVAGMLLGTAAATVASYFVSPMAPGWTWSRKVSREIAFMSRQILINTLVSALWMNADRLLGLRFATPAQMGLYAVAWGLTSFLEGLVMRACDIYFSMLSRIEDPADRAAWHQSVCDRVARWGMPVMALGVLAAPLAIRILYDHRYAGAGVLFSLLVARLMVRTLGMVQFQHLLVSAEVWIATRSYLLAAVAQVALLAVLGRTFGVVGIALAGLGSTMVLTATQSILVRHQGRHSLRDLAIASAFVTASLLGLYCISST